MMSFEQFSDYIQRNVLAGWKESALVDIHKIKKNNGIIYTGLYIREGEGMVTPAIYLEPYYDRYCKGEVVGELITDIRCEYEWAMSRTASYQFDISNYQSIRDRLIYRLVNYKKNRDLLEACPYLRFHDLAVTFRWLAYEDSIGISTALVTNQELELWNVSLEDLLAAAEKNTRRLFPEKVMIMDQFLKDCGRAFETDSEAIPMFIATNRQQINGAAVILYKHFLEEFAKNHPGDYFILPSSIHELILVPADRIHDPQELSEIVRQANLTIVSQGEVLSDSVYFYDQSRDELSIFNEKDIPGT